MTDEQKDLPEGYGEAIDWSVAEFAANHGGSTVGAPESTTPGVMVLSQDMLTRRLLWDTVPCEYAVETAKFLGLPAVSDDVEEKEHIESHQRLEDVRILTPILSAISMSSTQAIVGSMFTSDEDVHLGVDSREFQEALEKMYPLIYAASLANIAELVSMGLLHTPHLVEFTPDGDGFPSEDQPT